MSLFLAAGATLVFLGLLVVCTRRIPKESYGVLQRRMPNGYYKVMRIYQSGFHVVLLLPGMFLETVPKTKEGGSINLFFRGNFDPPFQGNVKATYRVTEEAIWNSKGYHGVNTRLSLAVSQILAITMAYMYNLKPRQLDEFVRDRESVEARMTDFAVAKLTEIGCSLVRGVTLEFAQGYTMDLSEIHEAQG